MVLFRSLKSILVDNTNTKTKARTFLTSTATIPFWPLYAPHHNTNNPLFRSPSIRFRLVTPFRFQRRPCPLFLTWPPWKLSQSATPLYIQGTAKAVVFPKVHAFNVLHRRTNPLPFHLLDRIDQDPNLNRSSMNGLFDSFVNVPNFISLSRLFSGPFLGWMITNEMYTSAMVGLAISGGTDWLDGYVARRMKIDSIVGSYLDPLADKVLICCVALAMVHKDLLHPGVVGVVVLRDVFLVGGAVFLRASSLDWKWKSWFDFFTLMGPAAKRLNHSI